MKRFYTFITVLAIVLNCIAQDSRDNELAIRFDKYFETDSTGAASVNLNAKPFYINTSIQSKSFVIDNILSSRNMKVAYVSYGYKREIWGKDATNNVVLLDTIDMNNSDLKKAVGETQKLIKHPWFVYFGGQGMFNSEYINVALNSRIGFFLLSNQWDAALSTSINISEEMAIFSVGLSSRYYFPMTVKEQRISPYIGSGINYMYNSVDEGQSQIESPVLIGVSWALGPGSFDLGMQYSKVSKFALTVGYTFFPWSN
jgi:hypothetical protein